MHAVQISSLSLFTGSTYWFPRNSETRTYLPVTTSPCVKYFNSADEGEKISKQALPCTATRRHGDWI
jgi:hypothetical protein